MLLSKLNNTRKDEQDSPESELVEAIKALKFWEAKKAELENQLLTAHTLKQQKKVSTLLIQLDEEESNYPVEQVKKPWKGKERDRDYLWLFENPDKKEPSQNALVDDAESRDNIADTVKLTDLDECCKLKPNTIGDNFQSDDEDCPQDLEYWKRMEKELEQRLLEEQKFIQQGGHCVIMDVQQTVVVKGQVEEEYRESEGDFEEGSEGEYSDDFRVAVEEEEEEEEEKFEEETSCGCCFDDLKVADAISCENGHLFCYNCAYQAAKVEIEYRRTKLKCFSTEGCSKHFSKSEIRKFLPKELHTYFQKICIEESIKNCGIENLTTCPNCYYAMIITPEVLKSLKFIQCENIGCGSKLCSRCKNEYHPDTYCPDLIEYHNLLRKVEEAKTDAFLRKCPGCKVSYFKEVGCDAIRCVCGTVSCYACGGAHSYGVGCSVNSRANLQQIVTETELRALEEARKKNVDSSLIPPDVVRSAQMYPSGINPNPQTLNYQQHNYQQRERPTNQHQNFYHRQRIYQQQLNYQQANYQQPNQHHNPWNPNMYGSYNPNV